MLPHSGFSFTPPFHQLLACPTFRLALSLHLHICCLGAIPVLSAPATSSESPCHQGSMPRSSANFAVLYVVHLIQPEFDAVSEPTSQPLPHCSLSALNSSVCCSSAVLDPYAHSSDCTMEGLKELAWVNEGPCQEKKAWAAGFMLFVQRAI